MPTLVSTICVYSAGICSTASALNSARDEPGDDVAEPRAHEPHAHELPDQTARRELRYRAQPDGTQRELAHRVQQIREQQPRRQHLLTGRHERRGSDHHGEPEPEDDQSERELRRDRRIELAARERHPEHRVQRRKQDDEDRIQRLKPARGDFETAEFAQCVAFREQVQRRSRLLEAGPEHRTGKHEHDDDDHAPALVDAEASGDEDVGEPGGRNARDRHGSTLRKRKRIEADPAVEAREQQEGDEREGQRAGGRCGAPQTGSGDGAGAQAAVSERRSGRPKLHETREHANACRRKAIVPVAAGKPAADERSGGGADVDAHVEDREARVATGIAGPIKLADQRTDVGLEQARAEHDENEAAEEARKTRDREHEVPAHDNDPAEPDCALRAPEPVGDPAARQRDEIDGRGVQAIHRRGRLVAETEPAVLDLIDHEQHEQRAHAVVAEALPHFREEQSSETPGMPGEFAVSPRGSGRVRAHRGTRSARLGAGLTPAHRLLRPPEPRPAA